VRSRGLAIAVAFMLVVAAGRALGGDFIADASTGCRIYNPKPSPGEAASWSGACTDGLAEGKGTVRWLKGGTVIETDEGEWRAGHQIGEAVQVWATGRYRGEVRDGLPEGHGVLVLGDMRYEGEFSGGRPDGAGTLSDAKGAYTGHWAAGCFNDGKRRAAIGVSLASCAP